MRATAVIVAYDSGPALARCLDSLEREADDIVVVNNGARGPEVEQAGTREGVTVVEAGGNVGFAAGCNLGARHARGQALVFLNPDTVAAPGAVAALVAALEDPTLGIATARLRLLDEPERLNSRGSELHVSGISWAGGHGEPVSALAERREVAGPSGAAMAIRAETFLALGGFDEELFMYQEDLDLGWRARLRGLRVVALPEADVYHDYEFGRNPGKHYLLERNRLVFVLSSFSARTLFLLSPVLAATELSMLALSLREGWAGEKLRGWAWCVRHARWLARRRRTLQRGRRVRDRELAPFLTPILAPAMIELPAAVRAANPLVAGYFRLVRRAL